MGGIRCSFSKAPRGLRVSERPRSLVKVTSFKPGYKTRTDRAPGDLVICTSGLEQGLGLRPDPAPGREDTQAQAPAPLGHSASPQEASSGSRDRHGGWEALALPSMWPPVPPALLWVAGTVLAVHMRDAAGLLTPWAAAGEVGRLLQRRPRWGLWPQERGSVEVTGAVKPGACVCTGKPHRGP